jgi:hypothetical protein
LNYPKNKVTCDDYGIFQKKQSKTEISKAFANLIQTLADVDVYVNVDVPAEPEKLDHRLLMLKERLNLAIKQQKNGSIVRCEVRCV